HGRRSRRDQGLRGRAAGRAPDADRSPRHVPRAPQAMEEDHVGRRHRRQRRRCGGARRGSDTVTRRLLLVLAACGPELPAAQTTPPPLAAEPSDAPLVSFMPPDAPIDAPPAEGVDAPPPEPEVWLKGSTHVHARPSGDSSEPVDKVLAW